MATTIDGISSGGSFVELMKRLQPQKEIDRLWKLTYPFLSMVSKVDDFVGSQIDVPLEFDHPARSRTFATAQGNNRFPSSSKKYNLTRKKDYATGVLDAETMHASRNNMGSWVRALQRETQNTILALRKNTAISLFRNHGGAIGEVSAIANGDGTNDRLTLKRKSDVINFSRGMSIVSDTADGTSGTVNAGNVIVRKLDFDNGYVYVGSDIDTAADFTSAITTGAVNDYLFAEGDFGNSFHGLASWIPLTAPSSGESYLGIDRSDDPMRLAGHRLNDTTMSYEEMVQELAARITYSGGMDLVCFMSPIQVKQFALELDTKVVRDPGGKGRAGFSGIVVETVAGPIEVLGDPSCPEDRMYLLDMGTWKLHHLKGLPHLVDDDGLARLRISNADQVEFRYRLWANLACSAPGKNGVAALPTAF